MPEPTDTDRLRWLATKALYFLDPRGDIEDLEALSEWTDVRMARDVLALMDELDGLRAAVEQVRHLVTEGYIPAAEGVSEADLVDADDLRAALDPEART